MRSEYYIGFSIIFSTSFACQQPDNTVGMVIDENSYGTNIGLTDYPTSSCDCNQGKKYFWEPVRDTTVNNLGYFSENNK